MVERLCCATYTDRQHRPNFVHGIAICPLTDISDLISVPRKGQLLVHELGESPHAIGTTANTHKLQGEDKKSLNEIQIEAVIGLVYESFSQTLTSPNISGRLWVLVPRLKW